MTQLARMILALTILLSGAALVPFVELPQETFAWQRYAGVYETPELVVNYADGQPGSYFHFAGTGYEPTSNIPVYVNDVLLGEVTTDGEGGLVFNLGTMGAEHGNYYLTVGSGAQVATERIRLLPDTPLRALEGEGELLNLPAGVAIQEVYIPVMTR